MEHKDKVKAIEFIKPNAIYTLKDDVLTWLDNSQPEPTDAEITKAFSDYKAWQKTSEGIKADILDRLGITAEEARLLLS
jgi:hypothetical protein